MPEQPTVIIQNTNQQNNDGCAAGCGTGCLLIVVAAILLWPISMVGAALDGEASAWWIPVGILLTIAEIALIGGIVFAWLDRKFGWGYLDDTQSDDTGPNTATTAPEGLETDTANYGREQEAKAPPKEGGEKLGRVLPHPDDPPKPGRVNGPLRGVSQRVDYPSASEGQEQGRDAYDRLRRLKELLDEGHITPEEYAAKKAELVKLL